MLYTSVKFRPQKQSVYHVSAAGFQSDSGKLDTANFRQSEHQCPLDSRAQCHDRQRAAGTGTQETHFDDSVGRNRYQFNITTVFHQHGTHVFQRTLDDFCGFFDITDAHTVQTLCQRNINARCCGLRQVAFADLSREP